MRIKKYIIIGFSMLMMISVVGCSSSKENIKDESKTTKESVIATSVAVTEILDKLGIKVDGVPTTSYELPKSTKDAVKVGSPMNPDFEIIKSLNPKMVVSVDTLGQDFMDSFTENNIPSEFVDLSSLEKLKESITKLGKIFDKEENAKILLDEIENKEKDVLRKIENKEKPKVLTVFAAPGSMMLATSKSYVGNIVSLAGGENILKNEKSSFLSINKEEISTMNPDIVLVMVHADPENSKKMVKEELSSDPAWKNLNAIKSGNVHYLDSKYFGMSANLKVIEAIDMMYEVIYKK